MFKIIGLSFVACLFLAFAALSGNKNKSRFIKIATTEFYVLTLLFSVTAAAFLYYTNYDLPQKRLRSEKDLQGKLYNYLTDKLSKQSTLSTIYSFPAKKASPTQHTPSKKPDYMVMFVGDSQTAGEGTSAPEHVFDKTAQRILSKFVKDKNIICSKMALSGGKTSKLLEQYKKLPKHNLRLCILNVRFSDFKSKQKEKLKQNLQEFIKLNAELNIKTVFMIQPINPDNDQTGLEQYTKKHITEPALQNNILVWDADKYMQSKNSTGFLWLDPMHMTSAGHKLLGAYLAHQLLLLLNNADV